MPRVAARHRSPGAVLIEADRRQQRPVIGVGRIELDRLLDGRLGLFRIAALVQDVGEGVMRDRQVRTQRHGRFGFVIRLLPVLLVQGALREQRMGRCVARLGGEMASNVDANTKLYLSTLVTLGAVFPTVDVYPDWLGRGEAQAIAVAMPAQRPTADGLLGSAAALQS